MSPSSEIEIKNTPEEGDLLLPGEDMIAPEEKPCHEAKPCHDAASCDGNTVSGNVTMA